MHRAWLHLDRIDAVIFDLDGVVTDTARHHAAAWKATFDDFLRRYRAHVGGDVTGFDIDMDFWRSLDGLARLDGARTFLLSRGIVLPEDGPDGDSVRSLAEAKARVFLAEIGEHGVAVFQEALALLSDLRARSIQTAVVSSSHYATQILHAAQLGEMFDVHVDGVDIERLGMRGKPDPAVFIEAARLLGIPPNRCAVIEDAVTGVDAARRGGFRVVIGVDGDRRLSGEMYQRGADVVVATLADIVLVERHQGRTGHPRPARGGFAAGGRNRTGSPGTSRS